MIVGPILSEFHLTTVTLGFDTPRLTRAESDAGADCEAVEFSRAADPSIAAVRSKDLLSSVSVASPGRPHQPESLGQSRDFGFGRVEGPST